MQLVSQAVDLGLRLANLGERGLVLGVEVRLAGIDDGGVRLEGGELRGRGLDAGACGVESILQPQHLPAHGGEPRSGGLDLTGEPRDLEVVARDEGTLRSDVLVEPVEVRPGAGRRSLGLAPGSLTCLDLLPQAVGLIPGVGDRLRRHPCRRFRRLGLLPEKREALVGERVEAPEPGLLRLEPERDAAGAIDGVSDLGLLDPLLAQARLVELLLQHDALGLAFALPSALQGDGGTEGHDVVGEDARSGVAHDARDGLRLAGDLGLVSEWLELAADLPREVAQPGEVDLHRVELADGLLFAAAVLEDPGGLFDEPAPVFRARTQHGVELPLPDDHVHLAAEPGVAQQLLHVEQPAGLAVDGVLAPAAAEKGAADRDLGIFDRQGTVGVVDREDDLGAAERTLRRSAGEDDVVHLAATERLGALLAHDPGEGVDDVGLARPVGPDDTGDSGLEGEGGGLREGLEALEREAFQVHATFSFAPGGPSGTTVPDTWPHRWAGR